MVEPVLIAASPGVHIDSVRPVVRIVLSDAVKQFAASLLQARPILRSEAIYEVVDHLLKPRPKGGAPQPGPEPVPVPAPAPEPMQVQTSAEVLAQAEEAPQRARAIFHAAEEAKPFDPADLSFEFDEHGTADMPEALLADNSFQGGAARHRGFAPGQWLLLVLMLLVELAVLATFVYLILFVRP
jgi:hypothetical protein